MKVYIHCCCKEDACVISYYRNIRICGIRFFVGKRESGDGSVCVVVVGYAGKFKRQLVFINFKVIKKKTGVVDKVLFLSCLTFLIKQWQNRLLL